MSTAALNYYTPDEYLALERNAEFKSEYVDGRIIAMAGITATHNLLMSAFSALLYIQFTERPCTVFLADMRVRFGRGRQYTYPDVAAVCGTPQFEDKVLDTLLNPSLIVEVLSDSTEAYDRGDKFKGYQALDSLREYVLVSQKEVKVERFVRQGEFWSYAEFAGADAVLPLESLDCEIPLREIYGRTRLAETFATGGGS
jgi:Uma2 family endonuclease